MGFLKRIACVKQIEPLILNLHKFLKYSFDVKYLFTVSNYKLNYREKYFLKVLKCKDIIYDTSIIVGFNSSL